nr:SulP family inorganic anion transporter [Burkholderia sp. AU16741]
MFPGAALLANYRRAWLSRDLYAGIALSAVLVPVGMSYAQAAGLPAVTGLYASIAALLAYAVLGPSRILVLGPDSALAALIAGAIAPLADHDPQRAVALSGALALAASALSLLSFVWRAWHPYDAVLGRLSGVRGYHDITRHPDAVQTPGLVLFRWDAPLFYANVEIFCEHLHAAIARSACPVTRIVVAAEPVTDIDVSAADQLVALCEELREQRIALNFAEMKGPVKDRLRAYGLFDVFGAASFFPTVTDAVAHHVQRKGDHAGAGEHGMRSASSPPARNKTGG